MKVVKFGGSSLASGTQVEKAAAIVRQDSERRVVVVSAPGSRHSSDPKVTDLLIELARQHLAGKPTDALLDPIVERYRSIGEACGAESSLPGTIEDDLRDRLSREYESSGRFLDAMKAAGEDDNAKLFASVLRAQGLQAHYVSPGEAGLLLSDEAGLARVLPQSFQSLSRLAERSGVLVFPGFFGYTESGHVVTFSRGGSDITGAILAAALEADVYENFTDVDSVLSANPAFVDSPEPIRRITYREMRELAYAGFSVLHDEALEPVFRRGIPVHVLNTNNSEGKGTWIVPRRDPRPERPVTGIAARDGFCTIYISKYLMNRSIGFGRRVLQVFEDQGISYEHAPSGIDNMSIVVRESYMPPDTHDRMLALLEAAIDADQITLERGVALIMLVGEGMQHTIGVTGRAGSAFARAGVNIEMINQGSSEVSLMFGIKSQDMRPAVRSLYHEFFP